MLPTKFKQWFGIRMLRRIFTTTTLVLIIAALSGALVLKAGAYYHVDWSNSSVPIG